MVRPTVTLPLPGDADAVLTHLVREAVRREGRLTWQERAAAILGLRCAKMHWMAQRRGIYWPCVPADPCDDCMTVKELPDGIWKLERLHRSGGEGIEQ